jgi:hypothetical protein
MKPNPFYALQSGAMVTGPAENLIEVFFGPRQADAHMQAYRWHQYTSRYDESAVMEALRRALFEPVVIGRRA